MNLPWNKKQVRSNGVSLLGVPAPRTEDAVKQTANDLNQLSMGERELVYQELHGVSDTVDESTPGLVDRRLSELQTALDEKVRSKVAYELALEINADYVTQRNFRLMFLRAERFNSYLAALRLTRHLDVKLDLFGRDLLCKDITQDDLDEETLQVLYSGWYQSLPLRDRAGRHVTILFNQQSLLDRGVSIVSKVKCIFYNTMVASRDVENQIHGRVQIVWISKHVNQNAVWRVCQLTNSVPVRLEAVHFCADPVNSGHTSPMIALAFMAVESWLRLRMRRHVGTVMEIKFELMTFGIPVASLCIDEDGIVHLEEHCKKWNRVRQDERQRFTPLSVCPVEESRRLATVEEITSTLLLENSKHDPQSTPPLSFMPEPATSAPNSSTNPATIPNAAFRFVETPKNEDVLMGRGKFYQEHLGNIRFRRLVDDHHQQYEKADKAGKTRLTHEIYRIITVERNGRFLRDDEAGWIQEDEKTARKKVSQAFRSARKQHLQSAYKPSKRPNDNISSGEDNPSDSA